MIGSVLRRNSKQKFWKLRLKHVFFLWKTKQNLTQLFDLGYKYDGSSLAIDNCRDRVTDSKKYSSEDVDEE